MKKENKKLAQERRAKQRKNQKIKHMIATICKIGIPVVAFLVVVVLALTQPFSSKKEDKEDKNLVLSMDSSLEVSDGNTVNIDYVGTVDGVEFEGGNTEGYGTDLVIGSGAYIDDFEEQLIGAHPGDRVTVNVTFPEAYGNEELNGKDAVFEVVINGIYVTE